MSLFSRWIERAADAAIVEFFHSKSFEDKIRDAVNHALQNDHRLKFVKAMQLEMLRVDPRMDYRKAWRVAITALRDWLHGEKIEFGDDRYDWSPDAAVTIIHELEIEHWEAAP